MKEFFGIPPSAEFLYALLINGRTACRYEYDALGRLTREDNVAFGKTTTWAYDNNGNIIAKYEYAITAKPTSELHLLNGTCKLYTYADNSDQLMSYNGEAFVYDTIGNPTTYRGKETVWEYGRQLKSYNGTTFTYDARGRRISKEKETAITFTYDSNDNLIKQSNGLEFLYDHTGVFAVKYNNSTYYYRKNAQNDIISLLDNTGATVVKYKYDAWGNCVIDASTTNTELANYSVRDFAGREMPGLAIDLFDITNKDDSVEYHSLTVSFGEFIGLRNCAYIDTNNCSFTEQLLEQGIATPTQFTKKNGYWEYPLWLFDEGTLKEMGAEAYEIYHSEYEKYMAEKMPPAEE